jgi:spore maturation protein CgeB
VHPEERQAISDRAYARAHREHTYEMRLQRMFETLGLSSTEHPALSVMECGSRAVA